MNKTKTSKNDKIKGKTSMTVVEQKIKLKPAVEIYYRILWDPNLLPHEFSIIWEDRFMGLMESRFGEYELEIPKHRIRQYKHLDTVVWDRDKRIDLISEI